MAKTSEYQQELADLLAERVRYHDIVVRKEWEAFDRKSGIYSPRLDIALGPFSVVPGESQNVRHDELLDKLAPFLKSAIQGHCANAMEYRHPTDERMIYRGCTTSLETVRYANGNPRCFIAIEIENRVSRKHMLGGALNACVLGRIGILVGFNPGAVRALVRLQAYWELLSIVGKPIVPIGNLIILNPDQMRTAVDAIG